MSSRPSRTLLFPIATLSYEDTSTLHITDAQIESSAEDEGLVYQLWVSLDGGATYTLRIYDGDRINGPGGGVVHFVESTGEITWTPTNADVTIESGRDAYNFRIIADDGNPYPANTNLSADSYDFSVTVANTSTEITAAPGNGEVTEDIGISYDVQASDEGHDWTGGIVSYYDLKVSYTTDGGATWTTVEDYTDYNDNSDNTDRGDRAQINFDIYSGQFDWIPNHLDTLVGQYQFTVTHHDDNGTADSKTFNLNVDNRAPDITLNLAPFVEDTNTIRDAGSDDETLNGQSAYTGGPVFSGVTYALEVSADGGGSWHQVLDRDLSADNWYQPHSEGGKIYFDTETGQIQWQPTNVDVTIGDSGQRVHTAYQFKITVNDGIDSNTETFSLDVTNTATDITTDIVLKQFTQGSALTVTDAEVTAIDEYHSSADDYYTLEILFNNTGEWIRVDNGDYNTQNNSWHGADIDYTTNNFVKTGAFDWTPVNSDVPNVLIGGEYQHQFRITHYDGHGSSDTDTFFVKVYNVPPTLDVTASHSYALIEDTTTLHITDGEVSSSEERYGVT